MANTTIATSFALMFVSSTYILRAKVCFFFPIKFGGTIVLLFPKKEKEMSVLFIPVREFGVTG